MRTLNAMWDQIIWLPFWSFSSVLHYLISGAFFFIVMIFSFSMVEHDKNTADNFKANAGGFYGLWALFTMAWPVYFILICIKSFRTLLAFLGIIVAILGIIGWIRM